MTLLLRRALLLLALPASLAAMPAVAAATTVRGVVVHRNAHAHSFVLAVAGGRLVALHTRRSPRIGTTLTLSARRLRNGTFLAAAVHPRGHARRAQLQGTVTYVNRTRGTFTLSARGASILIHRSRAHGAHLALASTEPTVGEQVTVSATLADNGEIDAESVHVDGQDTNGIDLHGIVLAVDANARTLQVSADDSEESGSAISVTVPASLDMSAFAVGQEVELQVLPQADGTNVLLGSALDGNAAQADNQGGEQGSQGDDQQHTHGDHGAPSGTGSAHGDSQPSPGHDGSAPTDHGAPVPTDHGAPAPATQPPAPSGDHAPMPATTTTGTGDAPHA